MKGGEAADGYVWPGETEGDPMHDRSLARALERATSRAGLPEVSPHRLRHTAASLMLVERVPLTVVAAQLGTPTRRSRPASTRT